jgi:hemerythrin
MSIQWTNDLNTGIDVIDDQHRRIVDYINKLDLAISHSDVRLVGNVLSALSDYCLSHLAFEESLMEEVSYPYLKQHKRTHYMFIQRLNKYQNKYDMGENVARQLHDMLSNWLVHHIKHTDMAYATESKEAMLEIVQNKDSGAWIGRSLRKFFS